MKEDFHVFQGIKRDTHPIKQEKQFLWEAHNIRLTTRDGDTMMSITNERSTKEIMTFLYNETYIGHVVLGKYLVLFTKVGIVDTIYRIDMESVNPTKVILYRGYLNLSVDNPIQAIANYEAELVQKVYWVDGLNTPRVINIAKPELLYPEPSDREGKYNDVKGYSSLYTEAPFSFVQDLELNEEVKVERLSSSVGSFPSGVVQYALTYCHKYGQESNIFYTSELLYTSFADRGGSPEDKISTAFKLILKNIDSKFQYIRVYSIMRTSIDAVPTVKRVTDIDISNYVSGDIVVVDNNTTGDIVDPNTLLYVGGKDITAGCITSKDNVLFLGDITYNRNSVYGALKKSLLTDNYQLQSNGKPLNISIGSRNIRLGTTDAEYEYVNQLFMNTSTFKNNDTYRLGCRFQYKNGEWSEPVWIDDKKYEFAPSLIGFEGSKDKGIRIGKMQVTLPAEITSILKNADYKKAQALIVIPSQKDRTVLAQGILCPTVGQVGNREQKGGAYAQSSWLLRPWAATVDGDGYAGSIPACTHNESLAFGKDRCVELQTMAVTTDDNPLAYTSTYGDMTSDKGTNAETSYGAFVVDQKVVTMHSPDIEFGDLGNIINSGTNLKVQKVGYVKFESNKGEIDIQTASPVADPDASGFVKRSLYGDGARSLVSGLFYEDAMIDDANNEGKFQKYMSPRLWMVYMWHRVGSLNNDCVRPGGSGVRTSELKKKCITNLKTSNTTVFNSASLLESLDIQNFNSNEVALTRLKIENEDGASKSCAYYGNVDTLIPAYMQYSFVFTDSSVAGLNNPSVPALSGNAITGGENKSFDKLKVTATKGTQNSISGDVTSGVMPYIVETTTTITSDVSSSSGSGSSTENDSSTNADSNTTITSTGTKTTTVDIAGKAIVDITISNGKFSGLVTLTEDVKAADGTVVEAPYSWTINGETTYSPSLKYTKGGKLHWGHHHITWETTSTKFNSQLSVLADSKTQGVSDVGDYVEALKLSKDGVRMKYKSTPHAVISLKNPLTAPPEMATLHLVELWQDISDNLRYGGKTKEALMNNLWIPAGPAVKLNDGDTTIEFLWGDTWFQRYDCLKTYPFTFEDQNQVIEIGSFFCETRVNIDGRYDRNRGSTSFTLSPINFNLINPVYSQLNNFFNTRMLDEDYYKVTNYPSQLMWTLAKNPSAIQDEWTNLHTANSIDLDGASGRLTNVCSLNELLIGFQETGISQILFNSRVQIEASDGVPIEIANSQRVEGSRAYSNVIGCQDKFSMVTTPEGIYFIDNAKHQIYLFQGNGTIQNLGLQLGSLYWPRDNYSSMTWRYKPTKAGNNGIRLYYDSKFQDVYFTPGMNYNTDNSYNAREALCFSEQLSQFTSLMSYGGSVMFSIDSKFYSIANNKQGIMTLYENFADDTYNNIFGVTRPFSFSFISNEDPTATKIFDTIEMRTDCYEGTELLGDKYSINVQEGQPLDYIRVDNEYQDTKEVKFTAANLRKKFRVWRATIPRNSGTRERIRNPWSKITLGCNNPSNKMTILHDLSVKYTI